MPAVLDRLRAQRAESLKDKTLTLPITGWSGLLSVRYRAIPWEQTADLLVVADDAESTLKANIQALIGACECLLVPDGEDDEFRPLADVLRDQGEKVEGQIGFDDQAAEALGIEGANSRHDVVLGVFAGAVSPELAIGEHAMLIGAWMRGANEEVDESLVKGS